MDYFNKNEPDWEIDIFLRMKFNNDIFRGKNTAARIFQLVVIVFLMLILTGTPLIRSAKQLFLTDIECKDFCEKETSENEKENEKEVYECLFPQFEFVAILSDLLSAPPYINHWQKPHLTPPLLPPEQA